MSTQLERSVTAGGGDVFECPFIRVVFQQGIPADVGFNGCRLQDVVEIAVARLLEFQAGPLACVENEIALGHLRAANDVLNERVRNRQLQGVFNSMSPHLALRTEDEQDDFSATGA